MKRADLQGLYGRNPSLGAPDLLPSLSGSLPSSTTFTSSSNLPHLMPLLFSTVPFTSPQAAHLLKKIPSHICPHLSLFFICHLPSSSAQLPTSPFQYCQPVL